ncbi:peptidylprolyl isomerase [Mycobacterium sp. M1]|uniref:Peptidyl-prolyl cis-trans isomerase n=1 Tax=Mycolicibacter acidiphilus TaxID=2835306 RepID=A0ABS5RFA0_9MYCO|nr:peptidylprolyl isomerase [Mycolicibacter acidiphilus]MBS9532131.1 peptidylprolyl isomerase [Mycolicibacter acidiphilus]
MPSNEERRAQAKRNLDQQVEQRAKETRQRRYLMIGAAVAAAVLAIGATTTVVLRTNHTSDTAAVDSAAGGESTGQPGESGQLPKFVASPTLGANCQYPKSSRPASKQVEPPRTGKVPTEPAQVSVSMMTDQGPIGLILNNAQAPCTVNSFVSLGNKDFFNDTFCHRLTTSPSLKVLQCGDPDGDGTGGPGYEFANEYPTDQYQPNDPAAREPVVYPRGTVAMANAGPGTNGSQFFLVYADSQLPPQYTVFGTIQEDGLTTLDKIAKAGVAPGGNGPSDGPPVLKVKIKSVRTD